MKKEKKPNGLIGLVVVTVLAFAVILGTQMLSKDNSASEAANNAGGVIDISGYQDNEGDIQIGSAKEHLAEDGSVDGYIVTVATKGFMGEILMDVVLDKSGENITSLSIVEQTETPNLGAKIVEDAFLSQFNNVALPVYLPGMAVESADSAEGETTETEAAAPAAPAETSVVLDDGTYTAETEGFKDFGFNEVVTLTISGGKITEVKWDAYNEAGEYKSVLSADGAYEMTETGLPWHEQAAALAKFVIENQSTDAIVHDPAGKTDSVSGVSVSVSNFVSLVEECITQATPLAFVDGTYTAEGEASNGYVGIVTMVIENGQITSLVWDGRSATGEYKSYLSSTGKYTMVEGNPTWKEQADALAANVMANQATYGIVVDQSGKTDSVAGVSISVNEFVALVEECFKQSSSANASTDTASDVPAVRETPAAPETPASGSQFES
ncbi:MAG: FMN-binding protein, partial [Anaerocolumna sp.]|nr:FMN-binding protein [Anaerocolumna sp.]